MKQVLLIIGMTALLLSACGPEPEPTMSIDEIQGTAVAAAFTMMAETQAAMPTATPNPPTATQPPTPIPTNTQLALLESPTPLFVEAAPTATTDAGDCNHIIWSDPQGPTFPLKIINETKSPVTLSLYLEKTKFGVCGYRAYQLGPRGETKVEFLQGVIWAYAWINDPKRPSTAEGGPFIPNNTDKWQIHISEYSIKMVGP